MKAEIQRPEKINLTGYYYHYKHDPKGAANNYAYFVIGAGLHTENGEFFQVYLPLYDSATVYKLGKFCDVRPLEMALEDVEHHGVTTPRFKRIEDAGVIKELRALRNTMYPELFA